MNEHLQPGTAPAAPNRQPESGLTPAENPEHVDHCEACGAETRKWLLVFHDGRRVCSACAGSTHDEKAEKKRKVVLGSTAGGLLVLIVAVTIVVLTGHWSEKAQIGKSLHAMRYAVVSTDLDSLPTWIDVPALLGEMQAACELGGDPNPTTTTSVIWQRIISTAVQGGKVIEVDGDRAVLRKNVVTQVDGSKKTIPVVYEMRCQGGETWKVTKLLNAPEIYEAHGPATP